MLNIESDGAVTILINYVIYVQNQHVHMSSLQLDSIK